MVTGVEFGGRTLRHRFVEYKKFNPAAVLLKKGIKVQDAIGKLFLPDKNKEAILASAKQLLLESGFATGRIDAEMLSRQILDRAELLTCFRARDGEDINEANIMRAVIGRLGGPKGVLGKRKDTPKIVEAFEALLSGDVEGFNRICSKHPNVYFDFSGMVELSGVDLKGVNELNVNFRGTYPLPVVARRNRISLVRINSGFCAGKPINAAVGAPDIICGAFKGALAGDLINAWLDLGEIPDHQAEIEIFPRKVQTKSTKGGFKYEEHYIRNLPGLCGSVRKVLEGGRMPVIIGGDHSIAFGTQGTINDYFYEKTGKSIGLIWIDAHADINTAHTTESGNLHGGPVAGLLGYIKYLSKYFKHVILPQNLVYIAMRDPDRPEIKIIQQRGIRVITVDEIKEIGVKKVMEEARRIAAKGTAGISVSFDIDAFDKELVPGTGTPVKNGLTREMGQAICRSLSRWEELLAFELVEINPAKDVREKTINLGTKVLLEVLINLEHSDDLKKFAEAGSAEIKSAAAEYLNKLEHPPKELDLSFKNITDAGLVYILSLQDLSQLRFVDLSHTRVGNKGLSRLARIITPKLIEVSISETEITPAGKMDFQNAKPKVKITGK